MFLIVIFGVGYMFFIRPRSQAARRQRDTLMELSPGDEVLTGAGIFGTVLDVESDRVTLETAPGTRITVLRSTIARRITDPATETPSWDEHDEDEAHGAYHEYEHDHPDDDEQGHTDDDGHAEHDEADSAEHEADDGHETTDADAPAVDEHDDAEHEVAADADEAHTDEAHTDEVHADGADTDEVEDKNKK